MSDIITDDRIKIFSAVRDIPYAIPLSRTDGSIDCLQKHRLLEVGLSNIGIKSRFRICSFLWSELGIPKVILDIPHVDRCEHLFLEVLINGKWVLLDATWDSRLKDVFKVNEWDGIRDTSLSVIPIDIYPYEEGRVLNYDQSDESFLEDITLSGDFYRALNRWLEAVRSGSDT